MLKRFLCVVILSGLCAGVQAQQFAIRAERRGNVFLIGSGVPGLAESCNKALPDSGKLSIICGTPVYRGSINFIFSDGEEYVYAAREATPGSSFAVLLRGKTKLPSYKRPSWSILTWRDRAYGDTVLLHKLLTKELTRLEYVREEIMMDKGKETRQGGDAVVMKISAQQAGEIRRQLKEVDQAN